MLARHGMLAGRLQINTRTSAGPFDLCQRGDVQETSATALVYDMMVLFPVIALTTAIMLV